jgi:hypothetical protein
MAEAAVARPLFGGAAVIELPLRFVDISQFREIPDTQEVRAPEFKS